MSHPHKIGELHASAWWNLGLVELRNAASFDQSNIQDDIRRSMYDARQEFNTLQETPQQQPSTSSQDQQSSPAQQEVGLDIQQEL